MKKRLKKKWIEALRSDTYKQGKGFLKTIDNKYCCTGVLLELFDPIIFINRTTDTGQCYAVNHYHNISTIPMKIQKDMQIENKDMDILIKMNDEENKSFREIADWVEANL
jgi:hypothetical protein